MSGMLSNRGGNQSVAGGAGNANSNSLSAQSQMLAEQQIALQQQIEMLQLQQQQLMQSANLQSNASSTSNGGAGNILNGSNHSFGGHRRIQSHAPRSGPMAASLPQHVQ